MTDKQRLALADELHRIIAPQRFATENLVSRELLLKIETSLRAAGTPVAWTDIAETLCAVDGNGFFPYDCSRAQQEAYTIRAQAVASLYAAPTHSSDGGVEGHALDPAIPFVGTLASEMEAGNRSVNALAEQGKAGIKPGPSEVQSAPAETCHDCGMDEPCDDTCPNHSSEVALQAPGGTER